MFAEVTNANAAAQAETGGAPCARSSSSGSASSSSSASSEALAPVSAFKRMSIIVAMTPEGGIGIDGTLPWKHLKTDMSNFRKLTTGAGKNAVVMGRRTWESIPAKFRPLAGRRNIVLSSNENAREAYGIPDEVAVVSGFAAVETQLEGIDNCFVIGGARLYKDAMQSGNCTTLFVTEVTTTGIKADTFFKFDRSGYECASKSDVVNEAGVEYNIVEYRKKPAAAPRPEAAPSSEDASSASGSKTGASSQEHEEYQYLNLIRKILAEGVTRGDRTGTGTISIFGAQMRFSLRNNVMPLLTTKRTFWRGLAEELVWFVSGSTNANELAAKDIHIWDGNGSREFLDNRGLEHREVGDLGPVYGYQWRHFGAKYKDMHADYRCQGVDQLAEVIHTIKTNPTSRRIVMSAWNPADLPEMALPPCHMFAQFYVANGELSCQMYQRSADMGLGVPFNIASYALLTRMIAHCCDLKPGDFIHTIGDAHVYLNHVEPLKIQLERTPKPFPTLEITCSTKNIDEIKFDDFKLSGYKCHKRIKMDMAV